MITSKEHKEIFEIVNDFGGEEKVILRRRLKRLLINKESTIKSELIKKLNAI